MYEQPVNGEPKEYWKLRSSFAFPLFVTAPPPVIREWAIVALRNLCENNPKAQEVVAALTPQGTAAIPELERAGAQIELDEHGRPRVRPPAHPE